MFWSIYKKEMLDSLRDRKTIVLSIMIPIVMILAMTLVYEYILLSPDGQQTYRVAVSSELDEESYTFISKMHKIEAVRSEDPEQSVRDGEAVAGLWAESKFIEKIKSGVASEVKVIADRSSMKGSLAMEELERQLNAYQETVAAERLAASGIDPQTIKPLTFTSLEIIDKDGGSLQMTAMLLPLLIIMSVMIGGQSSAVELFAGEKERKTMEALLMTPVNRGILVLAKWLTISTLGFISGIFAVVGFVILVSTMTERLKEALDFGSNIWSLIASALLCILLFSLLVSAIQIIFSLIAKNFKEAQSYYGPVMFIAMVPYFLLIGVGVNELSTIHFLIPVMNTFAILKELVYGIYSFENLLMTLLSTSALVAVMYAIAAVMFKKDKWVLGK